MYQTATFVCNRPLDYYQVVKALLVAANLHIPFSGGLNSYSVFLMVLAAYDRCVAIEYSKRHADNFSSAMPMEGAVAVTEGEVLLHFLKLFAAKCVDKDKEGDQGMVMVMGQVEESRVGLDPKVDGVLVQVHPPTPQDVANTDLSRMCLFALTPEQQVTVASGGCWIADPMEPRINVARPSFMFQQVQVYFQHCLQEIEVTLNGESGGDQNVDGNAGCDERKSAKGKGKGTGPSTGAGAGTGAKTNILQRLVRF
jgi:hypothetical protein